jgi:hypothetical protein
MKLCEATSVFPVLMIAEDDPDTGAVKFIPLPLGWGLLWRWLLWHWLPGAAGNLWRWPSRLAGVVFRRGGRRWQVVAARFELEIRMSLILLKAWLEVSRVAVS